ncbi:CCR4-NOT transcription complex subunit 9-like isoform X2 [Camellia sinensis]|uniref:CCR4-NOT transcription complex subunit 9-like isoform X2 n=1 Tax=Camellia sinensis TaxID=4442 RepID=UPI001035B1B8|nr:CCR4-NOT transcription complex subunit 9-like isoform X2 [Camellia sinensis]
MADEDIHNGLQDEPWEERTLHLLYNSKIDQVQKSGRKKHKVRWMSKRAMAIPQVIIELHDQALRESTLRCLSTFLLEKREEDPENYYRTGFLLYNSCSTIAVLLQEVLAFSQLMVDGSLTVRATKRLVNVLTLFQCIAANKETRYKFVKSYVPNFLVPLILFDSPSEIYENVRAVALSVFGILCQAREPEIIQWALESNMVEVCQISIEIGSELSKVIGMHIFEAIMQDESGMSYICSPTCDQLLKRLINTWEHLVTCLALDQDFSPRLLFHIIRSYVLLCTHVRGFSLVMDNLPDSIIDNSFGDLSVEFPLIGSLLHQLRLTVGKIDDCCPDFLPNDLLLY